MTDTAGFQGRTVPVASAADFPTAPILKETYWGFVVNSTAQIPVWVHLTQAISLIFGAGFAAATLGIWAVPSAALQIDSLLIRTGLSVFFVIAAYLLIMFANRGVASELQVDQGLGEVREVIRSRSGKSVLLSHYGFDAFVGMTIDRSAGDPQSVHLILRHQDESQNLLVATGSDAQIGLLYGRFERDLLRENGSRDYDAIAPQPL